MKFLEWLGLQKPPTPKKKKPYKRKPKVTVHLKDGTYITHYAGCRRVHSDGYLTLYSGWNEETGEYKESDLVAEYAPGTWSSISTGTRKVRNK